MSGSSEVPSERGHCQHCGKRVRPPARRCDQCWRLYGEYFKGEIIHPDLFTANLAGLAALQLIYAWWDPHREARDEEITLERGVRALERTYFKMDPQSPERRELTSIVTLCRRDHTLQPDGSDHSREIAAHFGAYIDLVADRGAEFLVRRAREIGAPPEDQINAAVHRISQTNVELPNAVATPPIRPRAKKLAEAEAFLMRVLGAAPTGCRSSEILRLGREVGFSADVMRRAANRLRALHSATPGVWALPVIDVRSKDGSSASVVPPTSRLSAKPEMNVAEQFLYDLLSSGNRSGKEVNQLAAARRISQRSLSQAVKSLGVRVIFQGSRQNYTSLWILPKARSDTR